MTAIAVDSSPLLRELREGLYGTQIHDSVFEMDTPDDFKPKAY